MTETELNHYNDETDDIAPILKAEHGPKVVYQKQSYITAVLGILPLESLVVWMQSCVTVPFGTLP